MRINFGDKVIWKDSMDRPWRGVVKRNGIFWTSPIPGEEVVTMKNSESLDQMEDWINETNCTLDETYRTSLILQRYED